MSKVLSNPFPSNMIDKISDIYENQTYLERYGEYVFLQSLYAFHLYLLLRTFTLKSTLKNTSRLEQSKM